MNIREISDVFKDTASGITALKSYNFGWASDRVRQGNTEDYQELNEFPRVFFSVPTITASDQTRKQDTYQVTLFFDDLLGYDNEGDADLTLQIDKWALLQNYATAFIQRLNLIKQSILPNYLFIPEAPSFTFDSFVGIQRLVTVQVNFNLVVPTNCEVTVQRIINVVGNALASGVASGNLFRSTSVTGTATATASVFADLTVGGQNIVELFAEVFANGNVTANITRALNLNANVVTDSTVNASPIIALNLTGNSTATAETDASAQLTIPVNASATATAETSANAQLTYTVNAEATATAETSAEAQIVRIISASATATAESTAEASFGVTFAANVEGTATVDNATIARAATMVASVSGAATVTNATLDVEAATVSVDYLVVGGGGAGGLTGSGGTNGGGGAGGFRNGSAFIINKNFNILVTVGVGVFEGNGLDSIFSTITSNGGGASNISIGNSGGSGGGGGYFSPFTGGSGNTPSTSPSQGNNGGNGRASTGGIGSGNPGIGGGGGGANTVGGNATSIKGGDGGAGKQNPIIGSTIGQLDNGIYYLAGGGGAGADNARLANSNGLGGLGGGGNGGNNGLGSNPAPAVNGVNGTANTGGGGGGGNNVGIAGTGGSGVIIISYPDTFSNLLTIHSSHVCNGQAAGGTTAPAPSTARAGYKTYTFTAGSGNISW